MLALMFHTEGLSKEILPVSVFFICILCFCIRATFQCSQETTVTDSFLSIMAHLPNTIVTLALKLLHEMYHFGSLSCMQTFFYELSPALPPFCELLCIGLFNTCPLMKTAHQVITESVAIVYPFHCSFVVTNLTTSDKDSLQYCGCEAIDVKQSKDLIQDLKACLTSQKLSLETSIMEPS